MIKMMKMTIGIMLMTMTWWWQWQRWRWWWQWQRWQRWRWRWWWLKCAGVRQQRTKATTIHPHLSTSHPHPHHHPHHHHDHCNFHLQHHRQNTLYNHVFGAQCTHSCDSNSPKSLDAQEVCISSICKKCRLDELNWTRLLKSQDESGLG